MNSHLKIILIDQKPTVTDSSTWSCKSSANIVFYSDLKEPGNSKDTILLQQGFQVSSSGHFFLTQGKIMFLTRINVILKSDDSSSYNFSGSSVMHKLSPPEIHLYINQWKCAHLAFILAYFIILLLLLYTVLLVRVWT